MFDIHTWLPLLGVLASILASLAKQWNWSSDVRRDVAYGISASLGVLAVWYSGNWDWVNILVTIGSVVGYQQLFYEYISQQLGWDKALTNGVLNVSGPPPSPLPPAQPSDPSNK